MGQSKKKNKKGGENQERTRGSRRSGKKHVEVEDNKAEGVETKEAEYWALPISNIQNYAHFQKAMKDGTYVFFVSKTKWLCYARNQKRNTPTVAPAYKRTAWRVADANEVGAYLYHEANIDAAEVSFPHSFQFV